MALTLKKLSVGLAVLAVPLLSGATLEQWRARPPRWETISQRSLVDLEGCLGSKWAATLSIPMRSMRIERGVSYVNDGGNRDILVDVTDEGDRRVIKLWLRKFIGITLGAKEQIEKLSSCANES